MVRATLDAWATSIGIDRQTLQRKMVKHGIPTPKPRAKISAKTIFDLLTQESLDPIKRLALARAVEQERLNKIAEAELIKFDEFDAIWTQHQALPLRQFLQSLPTTYDARCNSERPETARAALLQLRDDVLRLLRDNLPKPEAAKK